MKYIDISISKLQVSTKIPNFKRIGSILCREKCCCSHREIWTFIEHLRPQKWKFQLLSEESTTHNTTPCCKQEHQLSSLRRGLQSFISDPIWCLLHREIAFSEHGCLPTQHLETSRPPLPPVSVAERGRRRWGTQPEPYRSSSALRHQKNTYLQLLLLPVVVQHHLFLLFMTDHRLPPWSSLSFLEEKL